MNNRTHLAPSSDVATCAPLPHCAARIFATVTFRAKTLVWLSLSASGWPTRTHVRSWAPRGPSSLSRPSSSCSWRTIFAWHASLQPISSACLAIASRPTRSTGPTLSAGGEQQGTVFPNNTPPPAVRPITHPSFVDPEALSSAFENRVRRQVNRGQAFQKKKRSHVRVIPRKYERHTAGRTLDRRPPCQKLYTYPLLYSLLLKQNLAGATCPHPETGRLEAKQLRMCLLSKRELRY